MVYFLLKSNLFVKVTSIVVYFGLDIGAFKLILFGLFLSIKRSESNLKSAVTGKSLGSMIFGKTNYHWDDGVRHGIATA